MLGGGIGASRLAVPLAKALGPGRLTMVVNTADDLWHHGLRICPDLDTNMYALGGLSDRQRGWGVQGDTFRAMGQLGRLGEDVWFNLGDLDLATHLKRTGLLRGGATLSEVTADLAANLGFGTRLLPMTDHEVATVVHTAAGEIGFQEWFVRRRAQDPVTGVGYRGIEAAQPAPGVIEAIRAADLLVIGPSNPVASIAPILALSGVREAVASRPSIAVTPVVHGVPITGEGEERRARSRAAMLGALAMEHRSRAVASFYMGVASAFVVDVHDAEEEGAIADMGLDVVVAPTLITDEATGANLASVVLSRAM